MPYVPLPTLTFERIPIPVIPPGRMGLDGQKVTADKWCICSDIEACDRFYVTEANWMAKKGCYHVMRQCRGLDRAHQITDVPQCRVLEEKLQACSVCIALGHEPELPEDDPTGGNVLRDKVGRQCRCPPGHNCKYYVVTVGNWRATPKQGCFHASCYCPGVRKAAQLMEAAECRLVQEGVRRCTLPSRRTYGSASRVLQEQELT